MATDVVQGDQHTLTHSLTARGTCTVGTTVPILPATLNNTSSHVSQAQRGATTIFSAIVTRQVRVTGVTRPAPKRAHRRPGPDATGQGHLNTI